MNFELLRFLISQVKLRYNQFLKAVGNFIMEIKKELILFIIKDYVHDDPTWGEG